LLVLVLALALALALVDGWLAFVASATALFREDSIGTKLLRGCLFTNSSRRYLEEIILPVANQAKSLHSLEVRCISTIVIAN
jgi:hypothetical protein